MASRSQDNRKAHAMAGILRCLVLTAIFALALNTSASAFEIVRFKATEKYEKNTVVLRGELYRPKISRPLPAVVLMHGCGGWQPNVHRALRRHARYLVRHGFVVLNLDSFGPRRNSGGWVCRTHARLDDARWYRTIDAFDALKFLRSKTFVDPDNVFLMGQSNGGSVTIKAALRSAPRVFGKMAFGVPAKPFRAAAAYYPWCGTLGYNGTPDLASPLLVFGGGRDDWVSPKDCKKLENPDKDLTVIVYSKAAHSFDLTIRLQRYLGHLVGYNSHATKDSRRRMVAFFKKHLANDQK